MGAAEEVGFSELVKVIRKRKEDGQTLLIGIDGCGGAGKSTLAEKIKQTFAQVTVVHMDDFHLPSSEIVEAPLEAKPIGADIDWRRLLDQVLKQIRAGQAGHYQRYDWEGDCLAEWHAVPVGGIVVVEGVYSIRDELANAYDMTVWVDTPRDTRLERGLERDGEDALERWAYWMSAEDRYVREQRPRERAELIMSGTVNETN